ncbi:MAG: pectic acid lyase [Planctomycetaceae bacterium]|nr:pectic acid lyase [Planctomycetaceae bacterium]
MRSLRLVLLVGMSLALSANKSGAAPPSPDEAEQAIHRAVSFFRANAGVEGGYVFRVKSDLSAREGEVPVGATTAWIQPPGTPAVGAAFLDAYLLTEDPILLEAARETADALIRGQLLSGGWTEQIEFALEDRERYAYRVDGHSSAGRLRNRTTFDDNKSQSCLQFLMRLDSELNQEDKRLHECVTYAQDAFLAAQYPNGAWPQQFSEPPNPQEFPVLQASYPEDWPRDYPREKYTSYYTLNDNTISDCIETMLLAYELYSDKRFLDSAIRGGEFLLLAQMPDPQPGWAQQYNAEMHPVWARKFEPAAITGGESQGAMKTLIRLAEQTGETRFLEPIPRAVSYYRSSELEGGQLARFYELRTNRPLYFTKTYEVTYSADDLPTHYGFIVSSGLDGIERDLKRARERIAEGKLRSIAPVIKTPKLSPSLEKSAQKVVDALDERGAWTDDGWIESRLFIRNLKVLAEYIAATKS